MLKTLILHVTASTLLALPVGAALAAAPDDSDRAPSRTAATRADDTARQAVPRTGHRTRQPGGRKAPERASPAIGRTQGLAARDDAAARGDTLPDLAIRGVRKIPGEAGTLLVMVVNIGQSSSAMTRLKGIYHRSGQAMTRYAVIDEIAPGQHDWVAIDFVSPLAHADLVGLRADDPNLVAESDEGNNSHSLNP